MNLDEIRKKYPQYAKISNEQLALGLYKKYYSNMDFNDFSRKIGYQPPAEKPAFSLQPLTDEQKAEAARQAQQIRPRKTFGDYFADNAADIAYGAKKALSGYTLGASDWAGRKLGLDTGDDFYLAQRESEGVGNAVKGAGFVSEMGGNMMGAGGALVKGLGKTGMKGLKLASASGALEGAAYGATGSDNLAEARGKMLQGGVVGAVLPVGVHYGLKPVGMAARSLRPMMDNTVQTYKAGRELFRAKRQLNQLTDDPSLGIIQNSWNKLTGKGKSIDDVLNEENQRLARRFDKEQKIVDARRSNSENKISGYVYDTPVVYGGRGIHGRGSGEISQSVHPEPELVSQVDLVKKLIPNDNIKQATGNNIEFNEYLPNMENAKRFYNAMGDFKKVSNPIKEQVYQYSPEEYSKMRTFLTDDGNTGFAIKDDGDIVSVFKGGNAPKGTADSIMEAAVSAGGKKLDAYDTFLPEIYSRHGFREVGRDSWNEQFAPDKWSKRAMRKFNLGKPDVVYMEHDPAYYGGYRSPNSLQNVVDRLQGDIRTQKDTIRNIWRPQQSAKNDSLFKRSFAEALADENKRRTMRNAVVSGAEDLSERAKIWDDRFERYNRGKDDVDFENIIKTPQLRKAEESYALFIDKNGSKIMPEEKVAYFYNQHPIAKKVMDEMRTDDPRAFDRILPGSLAEFDLLKKTLREDAGNKIKVGASKSSALKRAENKLKKLMDKEFPGFRDVNRSFADARTTQDIFESKLKKGLTSVGGATVSPFWNWLSGPLTTAGMIGGYFNPSVLAITGAGLGGKALLRSTSRNAGRRLADGIVRTPVNINPNLTAGLSATADNWLMENYPYLANAVSAWTPRAVNK